METATMQTMQQAQTQEQPAKYYYIRDNRAPESVEGKAVFYSYPMAGRMVARVHPRNLVAFLRLCRKEGVEPYEITVADLLGGVV